jgi:hypothetical protein
MLRAGVKPAFSLFEQPNTAWVYGRIVSEKCNSRESSQAINYSASWNTKNQVVLRRTNTLLPADDLDSIENDASNNSSTVACIRCRGKISAELLHSDDRGIHIDTQTDGNH